MAKANAGREQHRRTAPAPAAPVLRSAMMATRTQAKRSLAESAKALADQREAARAAAKPETKPAGGKRTAGRPATKPAATKRGAKQRHGGRAVPAPERIIRIRELDPYAKCGPDTSVMELYRVDEAVNGAKHVHLVFFDRHGWYCLHGRMCPAVNDVRRMDRAHAVRTH